MVCGLGRFACVIDLLMVRSGRPPASWANILATARWGRRWQSVSRRAQPSSYPPTTVISAEPRRVGPHTQPGRIYLRHRSVRVDQPKPDAPPHPPPRGASLMSHGAWQAVNLLARAMRNGFHRTPGNTTHICSSGTAVGGVLHIHSFDGRPTVASAVPFAPLPTLLSRTIETTASDNDLPVAAGFGGCCPGLPFAIPSLDPVTARSGTLARPRPGHSCTDRSVRDQPLKSRPVNEREFEAHRPPQGRSCPLQAIS